MTLEANNRLIIGIATGLLFLLQTTTGTNTTPTMPMTTPLTTSTPANGSSLKTEDPIPRKENKKLVTVEQEVRVYFRDIPQLAEIAKCESHFRHTDTDGNIFHGEENDKDIGVMQINEDYHLEAAEKLGIDIYTLKGNMTYARYLYGKQGVRPWSSSKSCWNQKVTNLNEKTQLAVSK